MDSTCSYSSFPESISLTSKQRKLLDTLDLALLSTGIKLDVNRPAESLPAWGIVALDVEHDEQGNMVGIGLCHEDSVCYFTSITPQLASYCSKVSIIAHNGVSDLECLRMWGINVRDEQLVWDTMLIGHIIDSSELDYGLKGMAKRHLGITYPSYDEIVGKRGLKTPRITLDQQPLELVAKYNALDCYVTYKLYEFQQKRALSSTLAYYKDIEKPLASIFNHMSNRGISVDLAYLATLGESLEAQRRPLESLILNELGPINLNSPKQLLEALNAKGIRPLYRNKPSTDKRGMERLASNPIIGNLLAYSGLDTLLGTFVRPYLTRNQAVVHPFYNQCGTRTGRLSCSNPNLLQIPKHSENGKLVRKMFTARPGMALGDCDFGQIEPRVLAHFSKDPNLCALFNDGIDFHTFTATKLGIERQRAKILNLSVGYRATYISVSQQLKCTESEAQREIDRWWSLFPVLRRWQDSLIYDAKRSGFCTTLFGRRIKIDDLVHGNSWRREGAERQLINNITQGSAREIMVQGMLTVENSRRCNEFSEDFGLLVQVYDELLFESSDIACDTASVKWCLENSVQLEVPLVVDAKMGPNWGEVS